MSISKNYLPSKNKTPYLVLNIILLNNLILGFLIPFFIDTQRNFILFFYVLFLSFAVFLCLFKKPKTINFEFDNTKKDLIFNLFKVFYPIINLGGFIILIYLISIYGASFFSDYFILKSEMFLKLGIYRYLEDLSFAYLLSRDYKNKFNQFLKIGTFLIHAIFIGHRGVLLFILLFYLLFKSSYSLSNFLNDIKRLFFKFKLNKNLIKIPLITLSFLFITLLPNLVRADFSSLWNFIFLTFKSYLPVYYIFKQITINPPDQEQLIGLKDLISSFILYPYSSILKLFDSSPNIAVNFYLIGVDLKDTIWTPIVTQGGVTSGILSESFFLNSIFLRLIYIFLSPFLLRNLLITAYMQSNILFLYFSASSLFYLFSPYGIARNLSWILIIHFVFNYLFLQFTKLSSARK